MNISQPLYWHQGLFLQPHHLQHNDRRHADALGRLADVAGPHSWGVVSYQLAEPALPAGQISLSELCLWMRDGTFVEFPGNALLEPRSFLPGELADGPRTVYVGLRRLVPGQPNVSVHETFVTAARARTRFATLAEAEDVPDLLEGTQTAQVRAMHYVLRLFFDNEIENLTQYDLVPIARLERDGDAIRTMPGFVAPSLSIGASPPLKLLLRDLRDEIVARARQLEAYKQGGDRAHSQSEQSQTRLTVALAVLNRYGPLFTHWIEMPQVHPWAFYGALRQFIGELSWFTQRCDMLGRTPDGQALVAPYQHENAGPQFAWLVELANQIMNEITFGPEQFVRFVASDGMWLAELPESFLAAHHRYYLVLEGGPDADSLAEALVREGKLGTPKEIETIVSHALPGIELMHLSAPPPGMPRRAGVTYFHIDRTSQAWGAVSRERALRLFFPNAPAQFTAEVVAIRR
ncbi:type VI secretion system baseplate subunit TssK [Pandoraea pulmonicola]|uniref:Type VI secretion system-associated protein n=1 Tax=Pandoraea pulmonicola TaxID=93221 RepID=A0AAJ5CYH4_PANPU|nr:type VI secretion system baseplate subunit TssK [Pandoraea pulmonicola]AJC22329.1 type VI secretion system-associated protein [Pandoraea pulmonicola]SUA88566.1 Uncharacterized protein conserved in bacteria [Pandoraea pulmonicola]